MAKLIYICGMGHNGSTVIDLVLDRSKAICSVGQLNNLLAPQDPTNDPDTVRANFWSAVLATLSAEDRARLISVNKSVLKEKALLRHLLSRKQREAYAAINQKVIDAVFSSIDTECIVDSSKNVARIIGLMPLRGHDLLVIHLIRDVRGFVNSHNMRRTEMQLRKQYFLPTVVWFAKNLMTSAFVKPMAKNFITLKYEDILTDPEAEFSRLEKFIGEDLYMSHKAVLGEIPVDSAKSLGFSGNRILHSRTSFNFDRNRSKRNGAYSSRLYWLVFGWVSIFWGYSFADSGSRKQ